MKTTEERREAINANARRWRKRNIELVRKRDREYKRISNLKPGAKERTRDYHLRSKFGIATEDFNRMVERQHGVCLICLLPERMLRNGKVRQLCVDHDHISGVVRGLLCTTCNALVVRFRYSPELLRALAMYLQTA